MQIIPIEKDILKKSPPPHSKKIYFSLETRQIILVWLKTLYFTKQYEYENTSNLL